VEEKKAPPARSKRGGRRPVLRRWSVSDVGVVKGGTERGGTWGKPLTGKKEKGGGGSVRRRTF